MITFKWKKVDNFQQYEAQKKMELELSFIFFRRLFIITSD